MKLRRKPLLLFALSCIGVAVIALESHESIIFTNLVMIAGFVLGVVAAMFLAFTKFDN